MISLDEDYIGTDANAIIVRGLKVCGGVVCRLGNGQLLGAHYTSITTTDEIVTGCSYLVNHWLGGSAVSHMWLVLNLAAWQSRGDKYANTHTLVSELKILFRFAGNVMVADKNIIGPSVDVRMDAGNPPVVAYRLTLPHDPLVNTPTNFVKYVKTARGAKVPTVRDLDRAYTHQVPQTWAGFTPFAAHHYIRL